MTPQEEKVVDWQPETDAGDKFYVELKKYADLNRYSTREVIEATSSKIIT